MNVLLVPLGSHGDVHPFIGVGLALQKRGHRVRIITNPYFAPLIERAGIEAIQVGTAEQYTTLASNPDLWRATKGPRIAFANVGSYLRPVYDGIVANHVPGETVVVASTLAFGARVAEDRHNIPTITVHLQPSTFRSLIDPPKMPGMVMGPRVPRWMMALQWKLADGLIDYLAGPKLNALRKEVGLPPVRGILRQYLHSPRRVIGMFPEWYAAIPADWPPQTRLSGFPLYDERGISGLSPDLVQFLKEGSPPIAFTFGSAMWHAHDLLKQSAHACALLGRRGVLLTRHRDHVPAHLPPEVKHVDFAPLSELLPHCAALVHHGGIGTASQGLAAGVPQVVVPHSFDQFDNAERIRRLGVGAVMQANRYRADRVAVVLRGWMNDAATRVACATIAGRFAGEDGLRKTCEIVEEMTS